MSKLSLLLAALLLAAPLHSVLAHGAGCQQHINAQDFPGLKVKIKDVLVQAIYNGSTMQIAMASENVWEGGPSDGFRVAVYITPSTNTEHDAFYFLKFFIEYDATLFVADHAEFGPAWDIIPPPKFIIYNPSAPVTAFCSVSDNPTHTPGILTFNVSNWTQPMTVFPQGEQLYFYLYFRAPGINDPNWIGWDTAAAFSFACGQQHPQGSITMEVGHWLHHNTNNPCNVGWGQAGMAINNGCMIFDLWNQTTQAQGEAQRFCPDSQLGDVCISCPGCNYLGECWDANDIVYCNKFPLDCLSLSEKSLPAKRTLWQTIKTLYRD